MSNTKEPKSRKQTELLAYHEAGHAVMSCALRRRFHFVTIRATKDAAGHLQPADHPNWFRPDIDGEARTRRRCEEQALVMLGGHAAECVFCAQKRCPEAGDDWRQAVSFASYVHSDTKVLERYLEYLFALANAMLRNHPMNRAATVEICEALLERERLTYREVRAIYRDAGLPKGQCLAVRAIR